MKHESNNREGRCALAQETLKIVTEGAYVAASGKQVQIAKEIAECLVKTILYTPANLATLLTALTSQQRVESRQTKYAVTNESTLSAARRIVGACGSDKTLCLNFASAKNPGGGFLGGSQAQEESLARSSALYASLTSQPAYYEANRAFRSAIYTEHMILSPNVPVFRNDDGELLSEPYSVAILTAPAVNAGAVHANEPANEAYVIPKMIDRIAMVLAVAAERNYEQLILGAWGCGVFRNDPAAISALFAKALFLDRRFANRFDRVTFAVLDGSAEQRFITPFRTAFDQNAN